MGGEERGAGGNDVLMGGDEKKNIYQSSRLREADALQEQFQS